MSLLKKLNRKAHDETESGLGANSTLTGGRFFNNNGVPNMTVTGMPFWARLNIYHSLLSMERWKFLLSIIVFFLSVNLLFAGIYLLIGIDHLNGMVANTPAEKFGEAFFFSAQTFTTVGYGRVNPVGFAASFIAALEALSGLMCFAVVTGLLYGRFSRPKSFIRYSKNILFVPFKGGTALMYRMVPYTKNYLVNVEVKVTIAMRVEEDGVLKTRFFNLPLEISRANTLIQNWTLVHMVNDESPLFGLLQEDIANAQSEILIFVQGFDESFSNTVISRYSYSYDDIVYGARFLPMYHPSANGKSTILHLDQLDNYEIVPLPTKE
ncbi:MAG: Inward rectifier potassium channel Irk [Sphingobacteriia bacterium]|nr:Inward rectifier potassium channel Irk [Sphingobacteriia bacterium]